MRKRDGGMVNEKEGWCELGKGERGRLWENEKGERLWENYVR